MMKYKYLILFVFGLLIHACDDITDKDSPEDNEGSNTETGTAGIYVLSEGLFNPEQQHTHVSFTQKRADGH